MVKNIKNQRKEREGNWCVFQEDGLVAEEQIFSEFELLVERRFFVAMMKLNFPRCPDLASGVSICLRGIIDRVQSNAIFCVSSHRERVLSFLK